MSGFKSGKVEPVPYVNEYRTSSVPTEDMSSSVSSSSDEDSEVSLSIKTVEHIMPQSVEKLGEVVKTNASEAQGCGQTLNVPDEEKQY